MRILIGLRSTSSVVLHFFLKHTLSLVRKKSSSILQSNVYPQTRVLGTLAFYCHVLWLRHVLLSRAFFYYVRPTKFVCFWHFFLI